MPIEHSSALSALYDELMAAALQREISVDGVSKAISLRVGVVTHIQLEKLSEHLRDNKHSLAVETLRAAVQDLYAACELPALTNEEVTDWLVSNMKGVRRVPDNATAIEVKMLLEDVAAESRRTHWG